MTIPSKRRIEPMDDCSPFKLNSLEEVKFFEGGLFLYVKKKVGVNPCHLSLTKAFIFLENNEHKNKIFTSLLDIQVNYIDLYIDNHEAARIWQTGFNANRKNTPVTPNSTAWLNAQFTMLRLLSSFILKYRAIWDKIMGLIVMVEAPNEYENFLKAKSRKTKFQKISQTYNLESRLPIKNLNYHLELFDGNYRTAEAHGTGVLRKYILSLNPSEIGPTFELFDHVNILVRFTSDLFKSIFEGKAEYLESSEISRAAMESTPA